MCQQAGWDFEDMTPGGFKIINSPSAAVKVGYTGPVAHTGKYTFGIQIDAMGPRGRARVYQVGQAMCGSQGFVKAKYVTAWMMLVDLTTRSRRMGPKSYWGIRIATDRGEFIATGSPRGYNEWFSVSVPVDAAELRAIAFEGYFEPLAGAAAPPPWPGFVYVDDVTIE